MPVVWLGWLLGVPIRERIAGSDILATLRAQKSSYRPVTLFFFGGDEGVAEAAAKAFNENGNGARCVGWLYPGFHPIEDMSTDAIIDTINDSKADFLVVSLGARKGQAWLMRNAERLRIPVRAHFGASLNFEAGRLIWAPQFLQKMGMEWLWRIKQEPYLWRRYFDDGLAFLRALFVNVAPLITQGLLQSDKDFSVNRVADPSGAVTIALSGPLTVRQIDRLIAEFNASLNAIGTIVIDMFGATTVDPRFLGLLIVFRRKVERAGLRLVITGTSDDLKRQFQRHRAEFLINSEMAAEPGAPAPESSESKTFSTSRFPA